ncbi:MAG: NAD+ synthase [Bacteroidales bacterium]
MKIALAQQNYHIGNFQENVTKIISAIRQAQDEGADLVVFPELSVCGYPPLDLLDQKSFIDKCIRAVESIASVCKDIAAIVGSPAYNDDPAGKSLFNSAFFLYQGKVMDQVNKSLLPTYDVFDEYRYFEPNRQFKVIPFRGMKIGITICEDIWDNQPSPNAMGRTRLYTLSPMEELSRLHPDMVINISASPFSTSHETIKKKILKDHAKKYCVPIVYINQVGAHTELIFDGASMVVNSSGEIVSELAWFKEDFHVIDMGEVDRMDAIAFSEKETTEKIYEALILGIHDFFAKQGFSKAVLGLSGGIDSSVVAALAVEALGQDNVTGLLLPSQFTSQQSIDDAVELAENLGIDYHILRIDNLFEQYKKLLHPLFNDMPEDVTEENIQARIRGNLLMAYSNKFGSILLNTSNKSEAAVGYGTLYGDLAGGLSVLGDVYKTQVYDLARYINRSQTIIPENVLIKPPSAELRPNQKDSDSLPEYSVLDPILCRYIEQFKTPDDIIEEGFEEDTVMQVIRMVNRNEYKRYQTPPILRISSKAFGPGRKMPLVAYF